MKISDSMVHLVTYVVAIILATIGVQTYFLTPIKETNLRIDSIEKEQAIMKSEHELYRNVVTKQLDSLDKSVQDLNIYLRNHETR